MFHVLPDNFFVPLLSPNKTVYWDCICKLLSVMEYQLSFGVERDVLVDELEYYGWVEIETDKSYVHRVNFKAYAVRLMKILLEIEEGRQMEYQGYIYTIYVW